MSILDKILKRSGDDFSTLEKVLSALNGRHQYAGGQPYAGHILKIAPIPDTENQYSIKIVYTDKKIEERRKAPHDKAIEHNQERTDQFVSSVESLFACAGIRATKQDFRDEEHTGIEITFAADAIQLQRLTNKISDAYADLDDGKTGPKRYLSNTARPSTKYDYQYVNAARDATILLTKILAGGKVDVHATVSGTLRQSDADERIIALTLHDPEAVVEAGLREALGRDGISVKKNGDTSVITIHASHPDNKGFGGIMRHATLALRERGVDPKAQEHAR